MNDAPSVKDHVDVSKMESVVPAVFGLVFLLAVVILVLRNVLRLLLTVIQAVLNLEQHAVHPDIVNPLVLLTRREEAVNNMLLGQFPATHVVPQLEC